MFFKGLGDSIGLGHGRERVVHETKVADQLEQAELARREPTRARFGRPSLRSRPKARLSPLHRESSRLHLEQYRPLGRSDTFLQRREAH